MAAACSRMRQPPRWPVSGLTARLRRLPRHLFQGAQWLVDEGGTEGCRLFDRCGGSAGWLGPEGLRLLLPVELRRVNRGASTNARDSMCKRRLGRKLQSPPMPAPSRIDQIAERVERLLVRHEEVQRTNALLQEQVNALTRERDALKSRLAAARSRLDALLEQLPADPPQDASSSN
jgi:cell division protein ZapB